MAVSSVFYLKNGKGKDWEEAGATVSALLYIALLFGSECLRVRPAFIVLISPGITQARTYTVKLDEVSSKKNAFLAQRQSASLVGLAIYST